jgi:hypothetical protein
LKILILTFDEKTSSKGFDFSGVIGVALVYAGDLWSLTNLLSGAKHGSAFGLTSRD